jgi:hypothetical protein
MRLKALALGLGCLPLLAHASQPAVWYYGDDNDFRRGNLDGLALHPTLGVAVAPKLTRTDVDAEFIHCWLRDGERLWLGTGLQGKLYVLEGGKVRLVAKLDAAFVSALAADGSGGVYVGLPGKAEVVQVAADGKVTPLVKLGADAKDAGKGGDRDDQDEPSTTRHIWALRKKGSTLYAGTGPGGKIYAIDPAAKSAKVYADTGADHVLVLLDDDQGLLAGTSDPALIVQVAGEKQVRALASFPGVEVRSLVKSNGALYAAVNGGATAAPMGNLKPTAERPGAGGAAKSASANKTGKDAAAKGKGAVWRRTPDGIVQRVFVSPEGMLSELAVSGKSVLAGAARGGRVVVGDDFGDLETLFDLKEEEVLGVEQGAKGPATLFTGKSAAVYTVGQAEGSALFTTEPLQETGTAQWGRVEAGGEGVLEVETRSGFSEHPNDTWSAWQPLKEGRSQSPPATALQVRVKLGAPNARLQELRVFRQVANRTPLVSKIDASWNRNKAAVNVSWQADDADGDTLGYVVRYRPRGGNQWLTLHDRFYDKKSMELTPTDMPDGWYELRVEVSDIASNGPKTARATARVSKPFLVDRGRPEVKAEVRGRMLSGWASDALSRVVRVDVSVDGEPPLQAAAIDGMFDQLREGFEIELPDAALKGPHTLLIQVTDDAGNAGALRIPVNP